MGGGVSIGMVWVGGRLSIVLVLRRGGMEAWALEVQVELRMAWALHPEDIEREGCDGDVFAVIAV